MTLRDWLVLAGIVMLVVGIALESVSAALIVLGVLLLAAGLWSHHIHAATRPAVPEGNDDGTE